MSAPYPLSDLDKTSILTDVWERPASGASAEIERFENYFRRYDEAYGSRATFMQHLSHTNLAAIARKMLREPKQSCGELLRSLCETKQSTYIDIDLGLNFVANLFFCLEGVAGAGWASDTLLQDHLTTVFPRAKIDDQRTWKRSFNICVLDRRTDINITWTDALNEHLEMDHDDVDLCIFHSVAALDLFGICQPAQRLFPAGLINETMQSLLLMCPGDDKRVKSWLARERTNLGLDENICRLSSSHRLSSADRRLGHFDFWRDRLITIKDTYENHQSNNIMCLMRDYRRQMPFWAFWVALMAFVLSLIACILSAMQVYKAYHPSKADFN